MACFHAFMCALPHTEHDYLLETLQEYDSVTEYLISRETSVNSHHETNGQHFHFLVHMAPKDYKNYAERVFSKKYHLRGQAKKGLPRQYGKLREIFDLERLGAYTVKDGCITTNMPDARIKAWGQTAFRKDEVKCLREKIWFFLDFQDPPEPDPEMLELMEHTPNWVLPSWYIRKPVGWIHGMILKYFSLNTDKIPTAATIKNITVGYMLHHVGTGTYDHDYILGYLGLSVP